MRIKSLRREAYLMFKNYLKYNKNPDKRRIFEILLQRNDFEYMRGLNETCLIYNNSSSLLYIDFEYQMYKLVLNNKTIITKKLDDIFNKLVISDEHAEQIIYELI